MDGTTAEFEKGKRAAIASGKLLQSCKALLKRFQLDLVRSSYSLEEIRDLLNEPTIKDALTLIAEVDGVDVSSDPFMMWPVRGYLGIGVSGDKALEAAGIITFVDLLQRSNADLLTVKGIGPNHLMSIEYALSQAALKLPTPDAPPPITHPVYALPLDSVVDFPSERHADTLRREGIKTVADLAKWTADELLDLYGFGPESLARVEDGLGWFGITLAETEDVAMQTA
jgi:Bacterial RNA polymerase, alpha chain C terminal domain